MSDTITIKDKQFKPFIKHDEILSQVKKIANQINHVHKNDFPLFLVILNGSFMFASDLLREVNVPCEISFIKLASYEGTQSTNQLSNLIGLVEDIENRNVIIIEDIVDTGQTINKVYQTLVNGGVKVVKVATALLKPQVYQGEFKIDYIGFEIPNNFVVGYGLDYDGQGRNLKDIYVLV
jgi:hypoxanthine phosphoribosyltransferase